MKSKSNNTQTKGFALITTISILVLLLMIAMAMLSLSTVELRTSLNGKAMTEAQANARLALMMAIGELQQEMGPDMRISAEAAIHDSDPLTEAIDDVAQPHWLAVYDSWGGWLNGKYTPEGKNASDVSEIGDTYVAKRSPMFRRWLVSLPDDLKTDVNASQTALDSADSVILVGEGSLGKDYAVANPEKVTRAFKIRIGEQGKNAWWIGPENHKAKINLAARKRTLTADEWASAQGVTSEVAIGKISGLEIFDDTNTEAFATAQRMISLKTVGLPAGIDEDTAKQYFYTLTDVSKGILTSVRSGGLKKDLSLLLDRDNDDLPSPYKFGTNASVEPSIRPLSSDILDEGAVLPKRPFASWSAMRHYYRMYRVDSDLSLPGIYHTGGHGSLSWDGQNPYTEVLSTKDYKNSRAQWTGQNGYMRLPIIAKLTYLHSIKTEPNPDKPGERYARHLFSPVVTLWNPYNTEMRFPSGVIGLPAALNACWPTDGRMYINGVRKYSSGAEGLGSDKFYFNSDSGSELILKPGELKVFSQRSIKADDNAPDYLYPGFDPSAIGGTLGDVNVSYLESDIAAGKIGIKIAFHGNFGHNRHNGQTPGSLTLGLIHGPKYDNFMPSMYQIDWFNEAQLLTEITDEITYYSVSTDPVLVGYTQLAIKGLSQPTYESIDWEEDWRSRNWIQSPPFYFGSGLYMSENPTTAHTQRIDNPYNVSFGPVSALELPKVVGHVGERAFLGTGTTPYEKVTAVPAIELPTAPISSLAGFSGMRMSPGWIYPADLNPDIWMTRGLRGSDKKLSMVASNSKRVAYQSGITGPGIGNSFMHPMIPRTGVYQHHNNSLSHDHFKFSNDAITVSPTKAYSDYWDHVFLLNDALWDDYYVSTLANQTRPGAPSALSLEENIDKLTSEQPIANTRFQYYSSGLEVDDVKLELQAEEGYLKSAAHLMVDGSFNVNSTSVQAWYALFAGVRERQIYYRTQNGSLEPIVIPAGASIALSRFDTPNTDQEVTNPSLGVTRDDGNKTWSGVRFLTDSHLKLLAGKCVEQVKQRGPFLNLSEFINRRLSNDKLGLMGALQTAIDYDDAAPDSASINYLYKRSSGLMIEAADLGSHEFQTPEAAEGSRLAGTPGYLIQSDLLKPIVSTLTVRDDTFRIRAYGESIDEAGRIQAQAWCEAIVQRMPDYCDPVNAPEVPAQQQDSSGDIAANPALSDLNRLFGRKFNLISFRWLNANEI